MMAEPMKLMYNEDFLLQFGRRTADVYPAFQTEAFVREVMDEDWDVLELKERIRKISTTLGRFLPARYEEALEVLFAVSKRCVGYPYVFLPDFVEVYGQAEEHWELSMRALERFTQGSTAEFAVRPFLLRNPERMMKQMLAWTEHPSEHVRRLASEGCRPRLPWGCTLPIFIQDPAPILPVLERLKQDPSLYVRKSVANNLNDITKDHPSVVLALARQWKESHPHTDWIIRHGLRTLIRRGDPAALALFGYVDPSEIASYIAYASLSAQPQAVPIGGNSELRYELQLRDGEALKLRIEYGVYYVKASGRTSRKLFLLTDKEVPGGARLTGSRTLHWADLSTRRHYPGIHRITLVVNGHEAAETSIELYESE